MVARQCPDFVEVFVPEVHLVALPIAAIYHACSFGVQPCHVSMFVLLKAASGAEHACPSTTQGLYYLGPGMAIVIGA